MPVFDAHADPLLSPVSSSSLPLLSSSLHEMHSGVHVSMHDLELTSATELDDVNGDGPFNQTMQDGVNTAEDDDINDATLLHNPLLRAFSDEVGVLLLLSLTVKFMFVRARGREGEGEGERREN